MHIISHNYFQCSTQQITAGRKDSQNDHYKNCFSVNKHKKVKVKNRVGGEGGGGATEPVQVNGGGGWFQVQSSS